MREPTGPCSRRAAAGCHVKDSAHARSLRAQAVFQGGPLGGEGQEQSFNSDPSWVPPASLRSLWEMLPHSVGGLQGTGPVGRRGLRLPVGALGSAPDGSPAHTPPPRRGHTSDRVLPSRAQGTARTCPFRYRWKWPLHLGRGRGLWDRGDLARPPVLVIARGVCS